MVVILRGWSSLEPSRTEIGIEIGKRTRDCIKEEREKDKESDS